MSSATAPTPAGAWPTGSSTFVGEGLLVLGLPRGGVVVAEQVAKELGAPLDVLVVRKLGFPGHEELALGAVASGGAIVVNDDVLAVAGLDDAELKRRAAARLTVVEEMQQGTGRSSASGARRSRGGAGGRRVGHWGHDARPP